MVLTEMLLKHQFEDMSYESVGFTDGNLNNTNGTAIETIEKCSIVSPDILNFPELVSRYDFLVDFAKDFFMLILLVWLIGYVIQLIDENKYGQYASMIPFIKRSLIAMTAIICGMQLYKMLMDLNLELSIIFGGSDSLINTITGPFIGDMGCIMTGLSAFMITYLGIFYVLRYILLIAGLGLWVFGWLFWVAGTGHSMISHKLETLGLFLLQFVIANIFMGSVMCFVFWMGRLVVIIGSTHGFIGTWGSYMLGLCFCLLAGIVPILAMIWLLRSPRYMVHRITGGMI